MSSLGNRKESSLTASLSGQTRQRSPSETWKPRRDSISPATDGRRLSFAIERPASTLDIRARAEKPSHGADTASPLNMELQARLEAMQVTLTSSEREAAAMHELNARLERTDMGRYQENKILKDENKLLQDDVSDLHHVIEKKEQEIKTLKAKITKQANAIKTLMTGDEEPEDGGLEVHQGTKREGR